MPRIMSCVRVGKPLPRSEVVSKVWEYIKKHDLQIPKNKREIVADDKLEIAPQPPEDGRVSLGRGHRPAPKSSASPADAGAHGFHLAIPDALLSFSKALCFISELLRLFGRVGPACNGCWR
jgi:SWIB/MDM2 domain-containing protein